MIQLCRFYEPSRGPRFGAVIDAQVYDLSHTGNIAFSSLSAWLNLVVIEGVAGAIQRLTEIATGLEAVHPLANLQRRPDPAQPYLLPPLDQQEVWAAGVTYLRSRQAREAESNQIGIYDRVYEAERPEIFLKATPHRVVGPHQFIRARADAHWSVPEPELTVLISPDMQVVGYTVGNDVSSRDIEGENPLYLPQAKIYSASCALGPAITLAPDLDEKAAQIHLTIHRAGQLVFEGSINTNQIKRPISDLVAYLGRENEFPHGVFLMTGTGLVPPDDYTLLADDIVEIEIERIGRLVNPVTIQRAV